MGVTEIGIVRQLIDDVERGATIDELLGSIHPEIVVREAASLPYAGDHHGHAGFQKLLERMAECFQIEVADRRLFPIDDGVVGRIEIRFTAHHSGTTITMPVVEIYTCADGMVRGIDVYYKDAKAIHDLAALG